MRAILVISAGDIVKRLRLQRLSRTNDEQVKADWAEVLNQYQRRFDLVPNLVNTVKGYAQQEKDVLIGVTEARAKVGTIQATPALINDPKAFAQFQAAQGELTSALSKLMVVTENYPQLKSDSQSSATCRHNWKAPRTASPWRVTAISRQCRTYNVLARSFPTNLTAMMFSYSVKPSFDSGGRKGRVEGTNGRFFRTQGSTRKINERVCYSVRAECLT
jgi:LemA protein